MNLVIHKAAAPKRALAWMLSIKYEDGSLEHVKLVDATLAAKLEAAGVVPYEPEKELA